MPSQGSADLLSKVRGLSRPHAQEPQTSEKRGLRYSLGAAVSAAGEELQLSGRKMAFVGEHDQS